MTATTLTVVNARHAVGAKQILKGIDLGISQGEIVGLVGPNGSGKSTLLQTIVGAVPGASATVLIDNQPLSQARAHRARCLTYVEQLAPTPTLTVGEVVALGRIPHSRRFAGPTAADCTHVDDALLRTGCLHLRHRPLATLSGGERQRVLIARGLAQDTPYLLLDEPTNHLDLAAQADILSLIAALAIAGTGVLLAIHDLTHAAALCHRVIMIHDGRIVAQGEPSDVLTADNIQQVYGVATRWLGDAYGRALVLDTNTITRWPVKPVDHRLLHLH